MPPVVTDRVAGSVGLSVGLLLSPAKTAEPIEMPFELWARMGSRNHVLDGSQDPPMGKANFFFGGGRGGPL